MKLLNKRAGSVLVVLVGALVMVAVAFGGVSTDKYTYVAGETVYITGDGMNANEQVTVDVVYPDGGLAQEHAVAADGNGEFADTYEIQSKDPSGDYTVTAVGADSGNVFSTTFDPSTPVSSSLTLTLTPSGPIIYGQHTTLSGLLSGAASLGGKTINLSIWDTTGCTGTSSTTGLSATSAVTVGGNTNDHAWPDLSVESAKTYTPHAAGDSWVKAAFPDQGNFIGSSDCKKLTTSKAPTQTLITNTPLTTLVLGNPLSVAYKVESKYGVSGNTTGGTASIVETTALGTLGCGSGDTLSASQSNADGTGADDAGFGATGTLTCTPTAVGTYTYKANYSGENNYVGSYSSPDKSLEVTDQTVQVCKAAPAIAVEYMQSKGVKPGSKKWKDVVTDVAKQTGSNGQFFAQHVCDSGYANAVKAYVDTLL